MTSDRPFPKEQGIHCFVRPGFSLISLILIPLTSGSSLYISSAAYMHIGLFSVGVSASVPISYASSFFCWESRLQDESTRRSKAGLEDARNAGRFTFFLIFFFASTATLDIPFVSMSPVSCWFTILSWVSDYISSPFVSEFLMRFTQVLEKRVYRRSMMWPRATRCTATLLITTSTICLVGNADGADQGDSGRHRDAHRSDQGE